MTPILKIHDLHFKYSGVEVLRGLNLQIPKHSFSVLLGPSGCGKSTLLRLIAGLAIPSSGSIELNGNLMNGVPPHQRPVNTVFQSYALFPHLNVERNIRFGLDMQKIAEQNIQSRTERMLEMFELHAVRQRLPAQLSGGQKQRVAIARALINEPALLLLHEPLTAVDVKLRMVLQEELSQLQKKLSLTFLYVTHEVQEAMALADFMVVMEKGGIVQAGPPAELYQQPNSQFVAQFLGDINVFQVSEVTSSGFLQTSAGKLHCRATVVPGDRIGIRPEEIEIAETGDVQELNVIPSIVLSSNFRGAVTELTCEASGQQLLVLAKSSLCAAKSSPGSAIRLKIPPDKLIPLKA